jgi:hypothetical protein
VRIERQRFENERAAREEAAERQRREQAEAVYYRIDPVEEEGVRKVHIRNDSNTPVREVELRAVTIDPDEVRPPGPMVRPSELTVEIKPWSKTWEARPPSSLDETSLLVGFHGMQEEGTEGPRLLWRPLPPPFAPDLSHRARHLAVQWVSLHPDGNDPRGFYEFVLTNFRQWSDVPIVSGFELEFTDIHGTRWLRNEHGELVESASIRQ